ncbi:MAG: MaoC/PaaZ C-terminal domain-containing protein, partial [Caulobacteraceae bacterium]
HVEQDSRFLAPIRAGDVLVARAKVVSARASRAGAVVTTEFALTREDDGGPVAISRSVSVYRGVALEGQSSGPDPEAEPEIDWSAAERETLTFSRGFPHVYSEAAEIWNPIHTERAVAKAAGLDDIIIHGTALWAMAALRLRGPDPRRLQRLRGRFRSPIVPGTRVDLQQTQVRAETYYRLLDARGVTAVQGSAS